MNVMQIKPKDRKEFSKLLNEMVDVFNGAYGQYLTVQQWNEEFMYEEAIGSVMTIIHKKYGEEISKHTVDGLEFYHIKHFTRPATAAAFLFGLGVRYQSNGQESDVDWDMNNA